MGKVVSIFNGSKNELEEYKKDEEKTKSREYLPGKKFRILDKLLKSL